MEWIMYVIWFLTDLFKLFFFLSLTVSTFMLIKYLHSEIKNNKKAKEPDIKLEVDTKMFAKHVIEELEKKQALKNNLKGL